MPYSFGIIGCGQIGRKHAQLAAARGKLLGVSDINADKAKVFGENYNVPGFTDLDSLLRLKPDILVVCTPNGYHPAHSIAAMHAGSHVLCEKPMAIYSHEAHKMLETSNITGKRLFVVKQNRFNDPVKFGKLLLEEGKLGRIHSFQLNCFWNRSEQYFMTTDWRGTLELDGGPLYTQFSHFIDLLYWYLGDFEDIIYASGKNLMHANCIDFEDEGMVLLRMKNGTEGILHYSLNAVKENMEGSLTLLGERGTIKIGGAYLNELSWFKVDGMEAPQLQKNTLANDYGHYKGSMSNHHLVYDAMLNSLDDPGAHFMDPAEATKSVELIESIYKRLRSGGAIIHA